MSCIPFGSQEPPTYSHRYWTVSWNCWRSQEWRTSRAAHQLLHHGVSALLCHGKTTASLAVSKVTHARMQVALGEMVSQFPIPGGQFALAHRFVSPELGFAM